MIKTPKASRDLISRNISHGYFILENTHTLDTQSLLTGRLVIEPSLICKCMGHTCSWVRTCSHHSQLPHPSQIHQDTPPWVQRQQLESRWWSSLRRTCLGTSCILHSRCRTCRQIHSHSFLRSTTTFSERR